MPGRRRARRRDGSRRLRRAGHRRGAVLRRPRDSYSSGTGTRTYIADGTSCLRSVYAYPSLIASAKGYALNFRACSGAKVADVTNTQLSALTAARPT